jgi:branched-chain amino acid aminotransferase
MPAESSVIEGDLKRLVAVNGCSECTLRLAIVRNSGGMWEDSLSKDTPVDVIAMTADSKQWPAGARLAVQVNARFAGNEFAGAKILSWAQNLTWAERAQRQGLDEMVLLNQHGSVAECTSANIFASLGGEVFTPPLSDGCLPGITREVLLGAVRLPDVPVTERSLTLDDLYRADEVFMTSTTRDLLPILEIAGHPLGPAGTAREKLARAFGEFVAADIARRRNIGVPA